MANSKLVTVDVLQYNNEKIKEQLDKKVNLDQGTENKGKFLGVNELGGVDLVDAPDSVKVSAESDNQIEQKTDGIYVKDMSAKISAETNNALVEKQDGLYVPSVSETKVSAETDNQIVSKDDGIYVAPTDLSDYAKTEDIPEAYDDTVLSDRVTANEEAIATLNGTGDGSVKKTVDDALNKFATDISDDGIVNTYKELVDYAASHSSDVAEMVADIADNTTAIEELNTKVSDIESDLDGHTVKSDVPENAKFTDTVYELPTAGYGVIGGVKSGSSLTSASGYSYCPIIDGIPYYKTNKVNTFKFNTTLGSDNYYQDDSGNIVIKIPIPSMLFYQNIYDIYILNASNVINSNNPSGFSHLTVVPLTWAYPSANAAINMVNKTNITAGGAVITSFTATPASANAISDNYLTITVTGSTGNWQNYLLVMAVVTA